MVEDRKTRYPPAVANTIVICKVCGSTGKMARLGPRIPLLNWLFAYYGCPVCAARNIEVVPAKQVTDRENLENLRILYNQVNQEITRYRDYEWKIVIWSIALSWAVFVFSRLYVQETFLGDIRFWIDLGVIVIIMLSTFLLSAHLIFVHGELTTNRNWRERIRQMLGIYEEPSVFLPEWKRYLYGYNYGRDSFIIPFLIFMYITAVGLSYIIELQHTVPGVIQKWGPTFLLLAAPRLVAVVCIIAPSVTEELVPIALVVWRYFVLASLAFLCILAFGFVLGAIIKQGPTKRGVY